jgi:hypothetical protein
VEETGGVNRTLAPAHVARTSLKGELYTQRPQSHLTDGLLSVRCTTDSDAQSGLADRLGWGVPAVAASSGLLLSVRNLRLLTDYQRAQSSLGEVDRSQLAQRHVVDPTFVQSCQTRLYQVQPHSFKMIATRMLHVSQRACVARDHCSHRKHVVPCITSS